MAAPFKRSRWKPGFIYAIPLADGSFGLGQAIAPIESYAVDLALLSLRYPGLPTEVPTITKANVISIQATWRPVLNGGWWAKVGEGPLLVAPDECPNQAILAKGNKSVGCTHSSQGLLEDFLSAYHGLIPWNLYPAFDFDRRLYAGTPRPQNAKILDAVALDIYIKHAKVERCNL